MCQLGGTKIRCWWSLMKASDKTPTLDSVLMVRSLAFIEPSTLVGSSNGGACTTCGFILKTTITPKNHVSGVHNGFVLLILYVFEPLIMSGVVYPYLEYQITAKVNQWECCFDAVPKFGQLGHDNMLKI
ncbi:hypothetical protein MAM1_0236d08510 [Mucor ambiguus]|uniref:Uncharacterized protein n=1 Tax=Mucor ambiguus TaxID=91626 RepID=A0A0C9LWR6_9FUNG|nr:hypothetical protein MAM1_0236d08510 [Mucor ambiguus]